MELYQCRAQVKVEMLWFEETPVLQGDPKASPWTQGSRELGLKKPTNSRWESFKCLYLGLVDKLYAYGLNKRQ